MTDAADKKALDAVELKAFVPCGDFELAKKF